MKHSTALVCGFLITSCGAALADSDEGSILLNLPATPNIQATTVPPIGDVNPYGVAFVPREFPFGKNLRPGDILVSNFNNNANLQGTGTTIIRISRKGQTSVFFQGNPGIGLTTALGVLRRGFVLVGNVPTTDGSFSTIGQGSLMVLDRNGNVVANLVDSVFLNGPWDLTIHDGGRHAQVFVSNVLSGTVTRLDLLVGKTVSIVGEVQIASGYTHRGDPAALAIGPTGLAFDARRNRLYVASTGDNAIYSIPDASDRMTDAGIGDLVYMDDAHLRGPLGLVLAPNGHLITTNGDAVNGDTTQPSEMVEFTRGGVFVAQVPVNSTAQGGAFGIAVAGDDDRVVLAAVDDILNALDVWVVKFR